MNYVVIEFLSCVPTTPSESKFIARDMSKRDPSRSPPEGASLIELVIKKSWSGSPEFGHVYEMFRDSFETVARGTDALRRDILRSDAISLDAISLGVNSYNAIRSERPCSFTVQKDGEDIASAPIRWLGPACESWCRQSAVGKNAHEMARDACAIVEYLAEFIGGGEYKLVYDFPGRDANGKAGILCQLAMKQGATVTSGEPPQVPA